MDNKFIKKPTHFTFLKDYHVAIATVMVVAS